MTDQILYKVVEQYDVCTGITRVVYSNTPPPCHQIETDKFPQVIIPVRKFPGAEETLRGKDRGQLPIRPPEEEMNAEQEKRERKDDIQILLSELEKSQVKLYKLIEAGKRLSLEISCLDHDTASTIRPLGWSEFRKVLKEVEG